MMDSTVFEDETFIIKDYDSNDSTTYDQARKELYDPTLNTEDSAYRVAIGVHQKDDRVYFTKI